MNSTRRSSRRRQQSASAAVAAARHGRLGGVAVLLLMVSLLPRPSSAFRILGGGSVSSPAPLLTSTASITTTASITPTIRRSLALASTMPSPETFEMDDEWHPRDPAFTTPQLLTGIWHQIAQAGTMTKGESMTVVYPQMEEEINKPNFLSALFSHLDFCKDVCDHFGITTTLVPYKPRKGSTIVGFTAKSFRSVNATQQGDDGEYDFGYDPFWDDGTDFDNLYKGIDDEYEDSSSNSTDPDNAAASVPIENKVPSDDDEIIATTKTWVTKVMADMGICPFTQDADNAGLPLGGVFYIVDRHSTPEDMYAAFWNEVVRLEQNKEKEISTSLLIVPEFFMDNVELFESFSNTLTNSLTVLNVEELLQLVFFHPHWSFRDGSARATGDSISANYARRSAWPMINLLRTTQVRAAQKGIPTGLVYKQNEKTLASVGVQKLETMLRQRDWSDVADMKVNRRETDALKIAQDFQKTGSVQQEDISLAHDATPAANRVDRSQIEDGDLVTVLMQALDKRLGKADQPIQALNGPETSASAMAVDFLLQELDRCATAAAAAGPPDAPVESKTGPDEVQDRRQAKLAAARKAMLEDIVGEEEPSGRGDKMSDVLFGKGGIPMGPEDKSKTDFDSFNKGLDSFI